MTDKAKLEKIKSLADKMYNAAFNLTTDASLLRKAMDEYHKFIIHECKEEPVSEQNLSNVERIIKKWKEMPESEDTMTIRKEWFEHCKKSWYNEGYIDGEYNRDRQFEESVSEDLEKAIDDYIYTHDSRKRLALELDWKCCNLTLKGGDEIIKFAKHFFELGLKVQKGEL